MSNRRANLRLRKSVVALTGAAALTALLTACNGSATGTVGDASPKAVSGNAAPAPGDSASTDTTTDGTTDSGKGATTGATTGGGTSGSTGSGGTTGGNGKATGTNAAAGSSVSACQASQLGYSWAGTKAASGGSGQMEATVALTNKSGHACSMYGFPGVDLVNSGEQWSLQRNATTPHTVTVASGASAHFTITYLAAQDGDSDAFKPTTVVITAPNQRSSYDLPWQFGAVLNQDGATHPGTFIGPVGK